MSYEKDGAAGRLAAQGLLWVAPKQDCYRMGV